MGMTETSIFIERIFCFVDKTKSGTVSYQEFLQFIAVFTTGSAESKMELMFSVYDVDGDGKLSREDFVTMLGHLAEQAGESVEQSELDILLDSMLKVRPLSYRVYISCIALGCEDFVNVTMQRAGPRGKSIWDSIFLCWRLVQGLICFLC